MIHIFLKESWWLGFITDCLLLTTVLTPVPNIWFLSYLIPVLVLFLQSWLVQDL